MEKHHSELPGIWDRISSLMVRERTNAKKLAEIAGVVPSAVMKWKAGGRIGSDKIVKISNHFGVSAEWVLTGVGSNLPLNGRFQKGAPGTSPDSSPPAPRPDRAGDPRLDDLVKQVAEQGRQLDEIRKLLVSLLAEERSHDQQKAPPGEVNAEKKAG